MSTEEDKIRVYIRTGRQNQISCQKRQRKGDSMSGEEDKIRFHLGRGR
jgi:hypothetical protein